ncbi:hypothetical protein Chor_014915, partial [Crotalus horridus]
MAGRGGRGRGRGGGHMTFNVEAVGIGKGEALPPPTLKPSPLFPSGEEVEYMLALKQELRGAMKNLPYFIKPSAPKKDWKQLPPELKIRVQKTRKQRRAVPAPKHKPAEKEEAIKKLETLEKKEEEVTSEEEEEKEEGEEGKEEEEEGRRTTSCPILTTEKTLAVTVMTIWTKPSTEAV